MSRRIFLKLAARFPRVTLNQFCQKVDIAFCPINSSNVAIVIITDLEVFNTTLLHFVKSKVYEGVIHCADERKLALLPKEMRRAIMGAIEFFRNDGMVVTLSGTD